MRNITKIILCFFPGLALCVCCGDLKLVGSNVLLGPLLLNSIMNNADHILWALLVSCPAPFHACGEKGSGQTCIGPVSPVQHTVAVRANQMHGSSHMIAQA